VWGREGCLLFDHRISHTHRNIFIGWQTVGSDDLSPGEGDSFYSSLSRDSKYFSTLASSVMNSAHCSG
jgi:hypothetical protein